MKKYLCLSLAAVVLFGVLFGCGKKTSQQDAAGERRASNAHRRQRQPRRKAWIRCSPLTPSETMGAYVYHLFEGLYRYDETGAVASGAAETESVDESGRVWTFGIRSDARWSDGEPVRAQDFVYAWRRAVSPDAQSPYASLFLMIENAGSILEGWSDPSALGVEAVSDSELRVTFAQPVWRVSAAFWRIRRFRPCAKIWRKTIFPKTAPSITRTSPQTARIPFIPSTTARPSLRGTINIIFRRTSQTTRFVFAFSNKPTDSTLLKAKKSILPPRPGRTPLPHFTAWTKAGFPASRATI